MQGSPNTAAAAVHVRRNRRGRALEFAKQWGMLSPEARQSSVELARDLRNTGIVTNHKYLLTTYKNVVVGSEVVDWMVVTGRAPSREEATQRGQQLVVGNLLCPATEERDFIDSRHAFYRLTEDAAAGPSVRSLVPRAVMLGWLSVRKNKPSLRLRRQYCVLAHEGTQTILFHFSHDVATRPTGFINFEKTNFKIRYAGSNSGRPGFVLNCNSPDGRHVRLFAYTETEGLREAWIQAFVEVGAQYYEPVKSAVMTAQRVYEFNVYDINRKPLCLDSYKGRPLLVVNVASLDPQAQLNYTQLQSLYSRHNTNGRGLAIVAFPCNQFNQEPGSLDDIKSFAKEFGATFDLMDKVRVNGAGACQLFVFLRAALHGRYGTFVKSNFEKFLIDKDGRPFRRYEAEVPPLEIEDDIIMLLEGKASSSTPPRGRKPVRDMGTSPLKAQTSPVPRDDALTPQQPKNLIAAAPHDGMVKGLPVETPPQYTPVRRSLTDVAAAGSAAGSSTARLPYEYGPVTRRSEPNLLQRTPGLLGQPNAASVPNSPRSAGLGQHQSPLKMFQSPQPVLHTPLGRGMAGSPLVGSTAGVPAATARSSLVQVPGIHTSPSKVLANRLAVAHGLDSASPLTADLLPRAAREPSASGSPVNLEVMLSYDSDEFGSSSGDEEEAEDDGDGSLTAASSELGSVVDLAALNLGGVGHDGGETPSSPLARTGPHTMSPSGGVHGGRDVSVSPASTPRLLQLDASGAGSRATLTLGGGSTAPRALKLPSPLAVAAPETINHALTSQTGVTSQRGVKSEAGGEGLSDEEQSRRTRPRDSGAGESRSSSASSLGRAARAGRERHQPHSGSGTSGHGTSSADGSGRRHRYDDNGAHIRDGSSRSMGSTRSGGPMSPCDTDTDEVLDEATPHPEARGMAPVQPYQTMGRFSMPASDLVEESSSADDAEHPRRHSLTHGLNSGGGVRGRGIRRDRNFGVSYQSARSADGHLVGSSDAVGSVRGGVRGGQPRSAGASLTNAAPASLTTSGGVRAGGVTRRTSDTTGGSAVPASGTVMTTTARFDFSPLRSPGLGPATSGGVVETGESASGPVRSPGRVSRGELRAAAARARARGSPGSTTSTCNSASTTPAGVLHYQQQYQHEQQQQQGGEHYQQQAVGHYQQQHSGEYYQQQHGGIAGGSAVQLRVRPSEAASNAPRPLSLTDAVHQQFYSPAHQAQLAQAADSRLPSSPTKGGAAAEATVASRLAGADARQQAMLQQLTPEQRQLVQHRMLLVRQQQQIQRLEEQQRSFIAQMLAASGSAAAGGAGGSGSGRVSVRAGEAQAMAQHDTTAAAAPRGSTPSTAIGRFPTSATRLPPPEGQPALQTQSAPLREHTLPVAPHSVHHRRSYPPADVSAHATPPQPHVHSQSQPQQSSQTPSQSQSQRQETMAGATGTVAGSATGAAPATAAPTGLQPMVVVPAAARRARMVARSNLNQTLPATPLHRANHDAYGDALDTSDMLERSTLNATVLGVALERSTLDVTGGVRGLRRAAGGRASRASGNATRDSSRRSFMRPGVSAHTTFV